MFFKVCLSSITINRQLCAIFLFLTTKSSRLLNSATENQQSAELKRTCTEFFVITRRNFEKNV